MEDFLSWLAGEGDGGGKGSFSYKGRKGANAAQARTRKMLFKLKLQIKRMQKQQRKLDYQSDKARKKAMDLRKKGDSEGAKLYAKEMLKYRKLAANMIKFATNLQGMQFKLEQVVETQKMASMFESIDSSLKDLSTTVSIPELQESLNSINTTISELDTNLEVSQEGLELANDADVSDTEVDKALEEIDSELAVEGMELPSAGMAVEENEKIKDYKSRIDSLRD